MPLTSIDSSIQLRPCSGSSSIWRRSTLPATCDERHVDERRLGCHGHGFLDAGQCKVNSIVAFCPTSSSDVASHRRGEAGEFRLNGVAAGWNVQQTVLTDFVADRDDLPSGGALRRCDRDAGQPAS